MTFRHRAFLSLLAAVLMVGGQAQADKLKYATAVFSGLDKITGRIISFEVAIDETVQFGSLQITPRVCFMRPATEAPQTDTFVEVDEVDNANNYHRIFGGWMYAASPGLHGIEHPVYDVWLNGCKGSSDLVPSPPEVADTSGELPLDAKGKPVSPVVRARRVSPTVTPTGVPGAESVERRQPTQRFFPTTAGDAGHDPSGGSK